MGELLLIMIRGQKVILRAPKREDLPRIAEFRNDVELEIMGGGDPWWPVPVEVIEAEFMQRRSADDRPWFAIEADGKYIGGCGLFHFDWTARTGEIGIGIGDPAYRGRGYGRDAVRVLLDYAFRLRNLHRVWLTVHANNERAIRCYRACGFVEEGRLREHVWVNGQYVDSVCMGLLRDEWQK
jgi:RimJ/RimL family protein N-acetyltransferase